MFLANRVIRRVPVAPGVLGALLVALLVILRFIALSPRSGGLLVWLAWYSGYAAVGVLGLLWQAYGTRNTPGGIWIRARDVVGYGLMVLAVVTADLMNWLGVESFPAALRVLLLYAVFLFSASIDRVTWARIAAIVGLGALAVSTSLAISAGGFTFDWIGSVSSAEVDWSFDIAVLSVVAWLLGNKMLGAFLLGVTAVTFKRGALLAAVVGVIFAYLGGASKRRVPAWGTFVVYGLGLFVFVVYYREIVEVITVIAEWVTGRDLDSNYLVQGRMEMYRIVLSAIAQGEWRQWVFGHGSGASKVLFGYGIEHPHNDFVRIVYEYGIIGGTLVVASLALFMSGIRGGATISVLHVLIMGFNNNFVYVDTVLTLWLVRSALMPGAAPERRAARRI